MSAPAKFLFDVDFSTRARENERTMSKDALALALAEAEARGQRGGRAAAEAEARTSDARRTAAALERIAGAIEKMAANLAAVERRLEAEAVEVAVAVATKLAPELIAREPFAELTALTAGCFAELVGAPHVVVRVNDAIYHAARERLAAIATGRGFEGRLIVLAEPDIETGDCRVEWADGGVSRDRGKTERAIREAVDRYLAVRRQPQIQGQEVSDE